MKPILSLLFVLLPWLTLSAQRAAFGKMSPLVREACLSADRPAWGTRARTARPDRRRITAFVQLAGPGSHVIAELGGRVLARRGSLCIADLPLASLRRLSLDPRVRRIEAGRPTRTQMDTTSVLLHLPQVYAGHALPRGYTGRGVVVGVQDIGFDLTHPTFFSADGSRYRIEALWDQLSTDTLGSLLPAGRDYVGREALLALGCPRDGHDQTHGTHTAGTAAGSGGEGGGFVSPYAGVATEADLCLVCNVTGNDAALIRPEDYYRYTYALDALGFKYIFDHAERTGRPCVINFSEGDHQDLHGYDPLYYAMLDSLCGPGRIIVASAGNEGAKITYVHKPASRDTVGVFAGSGQPQLTVTTESREAYGLRLRWYAPGSAVTALYTLDRITAQPDSILRDTLTVGAHRYALTASAYSSSYDTRQMVCDWTVALVDTTFDRGPAFSLALCGRGADVQLYPVTGYLYHSPLDATLDGGDNTHSVYSPSSAPSVISVGATAYRTQFVNHLGQLMVYDSGRHGLRAAYSSVGPTFDGRTKPDVMAPGQNIISAYSSYYLAAHPDARDISSDVRHFEHGGRTYAWNANGGTSMAAPVVTGIIALWLQANPRLTPADCLRIFGKTCRRPDPSLSYPNNLYGYGEIDAYAGIQEVLGMEVSGIRDLKALPSPGEAPGASQRIYALDGTYMGTEPRRLPRGIYIRGGRKFVVQHPSR